MNSLAVLLVTTLGQFPVCEPVYVAPVYVAPVYTAPVVQCPKIYHNICYDGTIYTKQYVKAKLPGGKYLEVPVINGYLPSIDHRTLSDGSLVRDFRYDCRIKYTGKTPVYEPGSTCSKPPTETVTQPPRRPPVVTESRTPTPAPKLEFEEPKPKTVPAPSPNYEKQFDELRQSLQELKSSLDELNKPKQAPQAESVQPKSTPVEPKQQTTPKVLPAPSPDPFAEPSPSSSDMPPSGMRRPSEFSPEDGKIKPRY